MNLIHGHKGQKIISKTYRSWQSMCTRVRNPKYEHTQYYRGRGVDMDPRWNDFMTFLADMGERPLGMTLDRRDNGHGYWPNNCRWVNRTEQTRNRRNTRMIAHDGRVMPAIVWAKELNIPYATIMTRVYRGSDISGGRA